jgi:hypothetical protein
VKPNLPVMWVVVLAGCALLGCGQRETGADGGTTNTSATVGNPITAPADYVGAVGRAAQHSAKVVDLAQVTQAIQQFHAGEDRYPQNLDELVKEGYLVKLPTLPAGLRYEYNTANGQVKAVAAAQP